MTTLMERFGGVLLRGAAWAAAIYLFLPLFVICAVSFTTTGYLKFPPVGFTLKWYGVFLQDPSYLRSIWTSTSLAFSAAAIALVLGVMAALVLSRARFPGSRLIGSFFLSPLVLPQIVIGAMILQYASALGFARTFTALLVGHVVIVIPFVVRTTLASLSGFDESLEEASLDLGANPVKTFFLITLPVIKPGIFAGCLFAVIISWINVEISMFNSTAELITIPVKLLNYIQYNIDPHIAAVSASTIYIAVLVVALLDITIGLDKATG
jgi:putative spermidine/putrescine transport system permease protein